eukprot:330054_1
MASMADVIKFRVLSSKLYSAEFNAFILEFIQECGRDILVTSLFNRFITNNTAQNGHHQPLTTCIGIMKHIMELRKHKPNTLSQTKIAIHSLSPDLIGETSSYLCHHDNIAFGEGKLSINSNSKQYTAKQAGTNKQEHVASNSDLGCAELNSLFVQSDFVLMKEGDDHFVSWPLKAYKGDVACAQLDCQDMNEDSVKIDLMPVKVIAIKEWIKIDTEWMQNALNEAQKGNDQYIVKQYSIQQVVRLAHRVKNNAKGDQVIVIRKGQIIGAIQSLVEQTESTDNTYYVKRVDELVGITDIDDKSDKKSKKRRKKKTTKKNSIKSTSTHRVSGV